MSLTLPFLWWSTAGEKWCSTMFNLMCQPFFFLLKCLILLNMHCALGYLSQVSLATMQGKARKVYLYSPFQTQRQFKSTLHKANNALEHLKINRGLCYRLSSVSIATLTLRGLFLCILVFVFMNFGLGFFFLFLSLAWAFWVHIV